jgi:SSS family solute:Na+ symporter
MAQNFWIAICAWSVCFLTTAAVSLATRPKPETELSNLVYGLTGIPAEPGVAWYRRPAPLALAAGAGCIVLNLLFW